MMSQTTKPKPFKRTLSRFSSIILVITLIAACSSAPQNNKNTKSDRRLGTVQGDSISSLLGKARKADGDIASAYRIKAAELALSENNLNQAIDIVSVVGEVLSPSNQMNFALIKAKIALGENDAAEALHWLNHRYLVSSALTKPNQILHGNLAAKAYLLDGSYLASARSLININKLIAGARQRENQERIYTTLLELSAKELLDSANKAVTRDLRGWLSLAELSRRTESDPDQQLFEVSRWQSVWREHPAAVTLPGDLAKLAEIIANQPRSIALYLPLSGKLGPYGEAIRNGIISARLALNSRVKLHVYDSATISISEYLRLATNAGVELGIGPLENAKVSKLINQDNLPFPILALNRSRDGFGHDQIYQFGLAPEDEMLAVAERVFSEGKQQMLALYPDTAWGERNMDAFSGFWSELGGKTIDAQPYQNEKDYSKLIKSLLTIEQSQTRAKDLRRIIGGKLEFTPRRRQDIDFILLLGSQSQARRINPTLAFYYAEDIPVYSTSHVYEAGDSKIDSIDLNGIRFCDIPWKLKMPNADGNDIQTQVKLQWPAANKKLAAFYALGVDSFRIHPRLSQMNDTSRIFGATGTLQLSDNNVIKRSLMWAQFRRGKVIAAPVVAKEALPESAE